MSASEAPISIPFRDARFGESLGSEEMARMIASGAGKMAAFRGWFLFSLGLTIATVSVILYFAGPLLPQPNSAIPIPLY